MSSRFLISMLVGELLNTVHSYDIMDIIFIYFFLLFRYLEINM